MVATLPLRGKRPQSVAQLASSLLVFGQRKRLFAGTFQKLAIAQRIRNVKSHFSGLASAEKFSGTAQLQISLGDFKTVAGPHHRFQSRAGIVGHAKWRNQNAVRFLRAAADSAA